MTRREIIEQLADNIKRSYGFTPLGYVYRVYINEGSKVNGTRPDGMAVGVDFLLLRYRFP